MKVTASRTMADTVTVDALLTDVQAGKLRIPRFQRTFKWDQQDVIDLLDSIYRGYPIGTLLFWEHAAAAEMLAFGPVEIGASAETHALQILDGQQRITALAGTLLPLADGRPRTPTFDVVFDLENEKFLARPLRGELEANHLPLHLLRDFGTLQEWFQTSGADLSLQQRARTLLNGLMGYRVARYTLLEGDEAAAREVFNRLNRTSKALTADEVFTAAQPPEAAVGLRDLAEQLVAGGYGPLSPLTLLKCVLVASGADTTRNLEQEALRAARDGTLEKVAPAVMLAAQFVVEAGVPSLGLLPFSTLFIALVRFFHLHPEPHPRNRILLRRWLWRAIPSKAFGGDPRTSFRFIIKSITEDEDGSLQALLERAPRTRAEVRLEKYDPRSASCQIALIVMAARKPVQLEGHPSRLADILNRRFDGLPRMVAPDEIARAMDTVANRVLWVPEFCETWTDFATLLDVEDAPGLEQVLESNLMTQDIWTALVEGRGEDAVRMRGELLVKTAQAYVDARAEWEQEDRPPLRSADREEGGDDDHGGGAAA